MKKNVLHFIRKYSQLQASFIKNQIQSHVNFKPFVVYKLHHHSNPGGFADISNFETDNLNLSANENFSGKLIFKLFKKISSKDVQVINDYIKNNNIELLHFHFGTDAGIYGPLLKEIKIPTVVSFYGFDCTSFPKQFFGFGKLFLKKRVFNYVTKVLAMTEDMANDLVKIGCPKEKILVHYYGTDVHLFNKAHEYKTKDNITRLLLISGLDEKKGHLFLLKSFSEALKSNNNLRLTIVGRGIMLPKITEFIESNNLSAYVSLKPSVVYGSEEHLSYFYNHDIFIHPSVTTAGGDKEGIPGAIVEAMAAGMPVISTFHAGIPYIIENNITGILVKEWDIDELSNTILHLANNEVIRQSVGINGQKYALNKLDLKVKEKELEEIYSSLIIN